MQTLVPVNTMPQLLTPIKAVVSAPQFVQIERLVRGLLLVEGKRTSKSSDGSRRPRQCRQLNHFLAESPWLDADVNGQRWAMLASNQVVASLRDGLLFAIDTLTGEHYGEQMEGLAKYRDVTQPGCAPIRPSRIRGSTRLLLRESR